MATTPGQRFVRRHNAARTSTANSTAADISYDTAVISEGGYSWSSPEVTVDEAGLYLCMFDIGEVVLSGSARAVGTLVPAINSSNQTLYKASHRYLRDTGGNHGTSFGTCILDLSANDDVKIRNPGVVTSTDSTGNYATNSGQGGGFQLIRLNAGNFTEVQRTTSQSSINITYANTTRPWLDSTASWTQITFNSEVRDDDSLYPGSGGTITLAANTKYLITYGATFNGTSADRHTHHLALNIDGTRVQHSTGYERNNSTEGPPMQGMYLHETASSTETLGIYGSAEQEDSGVSNTVTCENAYLQVLELPSSAEWIHVDNGTTDSLATALAGTTTYYDTPLSSTVRSDGNSDLSLDSGNDAVQNDSGDSLPVLAIGWHMWDRDAGTSGTRKHTWTYWDNGGTRLAYGINGGFNRGNQGNDDTWRLAHVAGATMDLANAADLSFVVRDPVDGTNNDMGIYASTSRYFLGVQVLNLDTLSAGGPATVPGSVSFDLTNTLGATYPAPPPYDGEGFYLARIPVNLNPVRQSQYNPSGTTTAINTLSRGSTFVIYSYSRSGGPTSCSDNKGNTYTEIAQSGAGPGSLGSYGFEASIYICTNGVGGDSHTFTTTGGSGLATYAFELRGIDPHNPIISPDGVTKYTDQNLDFYPMQPVASDGPSIAVFGCVSPTYSGSNITADFPLIVHERETDGANYWCGAAGTALCKYGGHTIAGSLHESFDQSGFMISSVSLRLESYIIPVFLASATQEIDASLTIAATVNKLISNTRTADLPLTLSTTLDKTLSNIAARAESANYSITLDKAIQNVATLLGNTSFDITLSDVNVNTLTTAATIVYSIILDQVITNNAIRSASASESIILDELGSNTATRSISTDYNITLDETESNTANRPASTDYNITLDETESNTANRPASTDYDITLDETETNTATRSTSTDYDITLDETETNIATRSISTDYNITLDETESNTANRPASTDYNITLDETESNTANRPASTDYNITLDDTRSNTATKVSNIIYSVLLDQLSTKYAQALASISYNVDVDQIQTVLTNRLANIIYNIELDEALVEEFVKTASIIYQVLLDETETNVATRTASIINSIELDKILSVTADLLATITNSITLDQLRSKTIIGSRSVDYNINLSELDANTATRPDAISYDLTLDKTVINTASRVAEILNSIELDQTQINTADKVAAIISAIELNQLQSSVAGRSESVSEGITLDQNQVNTKTVSDSINLQINLLQNILNVLTGTSSINLGITLDDNIFGEFSGIIPAFLTIGLNLNYTPSKIVTTSAAAEFLTNFVATGNTQLDKLVATLFALQLSDVAVPSRALVEELDLNINLDQLQSNLLNKVLEIGFNTQLDKIISNNITSEQAITLLTNLATTQTNQIDKLESILLALEVSDAATVVGAIAGNVDLDINVDQVINNSLVKLLSMSFNSLFDKSISNNIISDKTMDLIINLTDTQNNQLDKLESTLFNLQLSEEATNLKNMAESLNLNINVDEILSNNLNTLLNVSFNSLLDKDIINTATFGKTIEFAQVLSKTLLLTQNVDINFSQILSQEQTNLKITEATTDFDVDVSQVTNIQLIVDGQLELSTMLDQTVLEQVFTDASITFGQLHGLAFLGDISVDASIEIGTVLDISASGTTVVYTVRTHPDRIYKIYVEDRTTSVEGPPRVRRII